MIRHMVIFSILLLFLYPALGQEAQGVLYQKNLKQLNIREGVSLHFVSPEPIQYVDISSDHLMGDIPVENVFRIKIKAENPDTGKRVDNTLGIVTIIGQKFIAQYRLKYTSDSKEIETQVEILPRDMNSLEIGTTPLSDHDLREFCLQVYKSRKGKTWVQNTQNGMMGKVNNIFTLDGYIFLDISYANRSNLPFEMERVRFKIEDQKIVKATNVQSIEVEPVYQLSDKTSFKRRYRNIYVFKQFTFPNNKILSIELAEKQISGRTLFMKIDYSDLLSADTL